MLGNCFKDNGSSAILSCRWPSGAGQSGRYLPMELRSKSRYKNRVGGRKKSTSRTTYIPPFSPYLVTSPSHSGRFPYQKEGLKIFCFFFQGGCYIPLAERKKREKYIRWLRLNGAATDLLLYINGAACVQGYSTFFFPLQPNFSLFILGRLLLSIEERRRRPLNITTMPAG